MQPCWNGTERAIPCRSIWLARGAAHKHVPDNAEGQRGGHVSVGKVPHRAKQAQLRDSIPEDFLDELAEKRIFLCNPDVLNGHAQHEANVQLR